MKYRVTEVLFHKPIPSVGSSAWFEKAGGKFISADFNTDTQMLTLHPNPARPDQTKRKVPVGNIAELVMGVTLPNDK